ncbi:MAG: copper amine oxidase family proteinLeucine Rich Repeat (LRR)-containing [Clostridiaceae bacterium]|jgi:hypothetical protein|nr:copper amine oxidase family proteinLeucine Rich Repeat (LRR)-containing [Clostridiaceae bacterium]
MIKKSMILVLILIFIFNFTAFGFDVNDGRDTVFTKYYYRKANILNVLREEKEIKFDVKPQILNGKTLVPIRAIFETLELNVEWDNVNQIVKGKNEENTIIFKIGSNKAIVNGKLIELDTSVIIINNRTLIPLNFLTKMGYKSVVLEGEYTDAGINSIYLKLK